MEGYFILKLMCQNIIYIDWHENEGAAQKNPKSEIVAEWDWEPTVNWLILFLHQNEIFTSDSEHTVQPATM